MRSGADNPPICSQLSTGGGAAIVVVDFQALNDGTRLSKLLSEAAVGQRFYQVDPLAALSGDRLYAALPDMADESVAVFRSCESAQVTEQRVFVVGQCSAAGLSLQIADRLLDTHEVSAILVQPSWPEAEHIAEQFADFQRKLGLSSRPCPDLETDPWTWSAEIEQSIREGLDGLATRLGLGAPPLAFTELLLSYRAWLAFLLACRNERPAKAPGDALTVSVLTDEPDFVWSGADPDRCRITPLPPAERSNAMTPDLAKMVLEQITN